jgi:membrane-associated protease RseP (regulator of RpoE activity)
MSPRVLTTFVVATGLMFGGTCGPARADNPMGYRLVSAQDAGNLPRNGGVLGLDVERAQQITDSGMTFELMRVMQVRPGSPGAAAGFHVGDQIIAVDGRVFPTIAAFAAYVGSVSPGTQAAVDYIPSGGGPGQAQRISVTVGGAGRVTAPQTPAPATDSPARSTGLSTGTKVAIGAGAAALFGCYELGCFSRRQSSRPATPMATGQRPALPAQQGVQQFR